MFRVVRCCCRERKRNVTCTSTEASGGIGDSLCFTCPEGTFGGTKGCVDCDRARRCVDTATHLLCPDNELLVRSQCAPSTQQDPTLVLNNHVVGCTETCFADFAVCGACPPSCVSCTNSSSCAVCAAGTSLSSDGACSVLQRATSQTHAVWWVVLLVVIGFSSLLSSVLCRSFLPSTPSSDASG